MQQNELPDTEPVTIAVTGSSGFVGGWLVQRLQTLAQSQPIRLVRLLDDRDGSRPDIRNAAAVYDEIAATKPAAVIHLAAVAAPSQAQDDPQSAWGVNVMGTLTLARAILAYAPDARLVFAGSSEAYGASFNRAKVPVDEHTPFEPVNTYGASKAAADIMLGQMARQGLRAVRFRPFNQTGPGQAPIYVASNFARQIALIEAGLQEPVMHVGNLSAKRDFIDVRDVVEAYVAAAICQPEVEPGTSINLSSGTPISIKELLDMLVAASTKDIRIEVDPNRLRPNDLPYASGDPTRAGELLGWRPHRPIRDTLIQLLDAWRSTVTSKMTDGSARNLS